MVWFLVDDNLHSNRKVRKVLADDPAALALWTVAGSWCADELTNGFVPDDQLKWLLPAGAETLAQKLVNARLWTKARGGFQFHQWNTDGDGTKRNPTKEEVVEKRRLRAEAGRKGGLVSGKRRSKAQARAPANAKAGASQSVQPQLPSPSKEGKRGAPASPGGAPPENPAVGSPPNGEIPDPDRRAELAAQARAQIRKRAAPARDPFTPPQPDKGQSALAALDDAVAKLQPAHQEEAET